MLNLKAFLTSTPQFSMLHPSCSRRKPA